MTSNVPTSRRRRTSWLMGAACAATIAATGVAAQPAAAGVPEPDCNSIWTRPGSGFYENNKPYVDHRIDTGVWPTAAPTAENVDAATIDAGVDRISHNARLRSVLVARHGKLVYERYVNGGSAQQSNNLHSASKSMLQALLGIAVHQGAISSLDDPASSYLPASYFSGQPAWKRTITLRQLISMTSRLAWVEDKTEDSIASTDNWVKAIIQRPGRYTPPKSDPGNDFNYSTGNTHILSAVLTHATGESTCAFAEKNLFSELGVAPEHWGRDPQAVYSGGYNLYMTARELARFAQMYLDNGRVGTRQVVPAITVRQAATPLNHDPGDDVYSYDQGWWSRTISGYHTYYAWGYGGQFAYVIPALDIVFVATENTQGGEHEIDSGKFVEKNLIPAVTGP